ncbi:MAG: hypothetical protein JKY02_10105 [Flavobacteriaceae bacterium]|nr:hypothetical protein [Flavobacteriaceae bacterium]
MSGIDKHIAIPKNVATKDDLDFYFLKQLGIEYIEELGGDLWTDLNSHDPGVTMTEMLSYAITDLGNRIETPIENLLTSNDPSHTIDSQFHKASEVFPSKPVNELDYRKLFIDIKGVRNCWLEKYKKQVYVSCQDNELTYNENKFSHLDITLRDDFKLKGLYTLLVEFDAFDEKFSQEKQEKEIELIKEAIKKKYHQNRNLCEDLVVIQKVETQAVSVCANIEVEKEANEEEVHANVLFEINNYFSPFPQFYSIKEMLAKGYTPDQIFDGPLLDNGFIDTEELKEADLRKEVRLSDLMKIITNIDGVKLIKDISIGHCDSSKKLKNDWVICLDPEKKPILCDKSTLNYSKGVLPLNINEVEVERFKKELEQEALIQQTQAKKDKRLDFPNGTYVEANAYSTIQNDFPDTYGIGQEGLSARATTERKSQAKQLKSYLLFFDKILANYFQHLSKVKDLLSINRTETKTYFAQTVTGIKGFEDLVDEYPTNNEVELTELLFDKFDNNIERRNEILDHLLARFAEKFGDYAFLMKTLYGSVSDEIILANKEAFLKDYIAISSQRGSAFNYYKQPIDTLWNTDNIAGFQKRVSRLVGVKNYSRRDLTSSYIEVYEFIDSNSKKVYRWRVRDTEGTIILASTANYKTIVKATDELYFAVLQIIQASEKSIENTFKKAFENRTVIDNIEVYQTDSGEYSSRIINPDIPKSSIGYIIGKQFKDYASLEGLEEALVALISFFKHQFSEEGMFLVEHILLRPDVTNNTAKKEEFMPICADDCDDCSIDPYSYRVSIVLPGYTYRFSNPDFRNYIENIIKEELPAHILPRICWVGHRRNMVKDEENDLWCFENAYKDYLLAKTNLDQEQPQENNEHKNLIDTMSKLNSIYPIGRLLDCADESDELEGRIILGQTNLGTLKTDSDGD